jgi:putative membrane protein
MVRRFSRAAPALVVGALFIGPVAGAQASSSSAFSGLDEQYLQSAIQGDRFEIEGGQLAQSKGSTTVVRALGARLFKDHSKSLKDSIRLAKRLGISVPKTPTPSQAWELSMVNTLSGNNFDRWYSDLEVQDHKQDIEEARNEVDDGFNSAIRTSAAAEIPVLRTHLQLSRNALKASGEV